MPDIGTIPLDILPYECLVGRATESIPYANTDVQRSWVTSTVKCDIQLVLGSAVRRIYGTERSEFHRAFLPPTANIQVGDVMAATDGPWQSDHFNVIRVIKFREHHIEADMEYSDDHTTANTLSA
jgi:hypothetical protein